MINKYVGFLITLMLLGSLATAEGPGRGSKHDRDEMRTKIKSELGLSKEQEKKLETHRIDQRAEMEKLMLTVREKRDELKTALENPQMNKHDVERINDELKDAQNEMADKRLEGILYVREVLTPDQFKKFLALRPEHGERGRNREGQGRINDHNYRRDESKRHSHDNTHEAMDDDPMEMPKPQ